LYTLSALLVRYKLFYLKLSLLLRFWWLDQETIVHRALDVRGDENSAWVHQRELSEISCEKNAKRLW